MIKLLYKIGLIFVFLLILISIDDLIWDIFYACKKARGKISLESIDIKSIEQTRPKMLAVIVAAYNEEDVLKDVITNLIISNQYPRSMYHIFLGVYPNDPGTLRVADELENEFDNVHKIVHVLDGPSSKADNLNNVIKNIYSFEERNSLEFAAVIIHDSEDLVHPYEFKFENYLLEKYPLIQIPVFPLQEMPKPSNFFKNMISGTYADEFAENHYRLLVARNATDSFVPSAGTGFVLRRDVLESFPDNNIFPVGSLTEDYRLSLQLKRKGYDIHYALENISRLRSDGKVVREFISTRSMFPSTYRAAVRQKTRWIYGITIQTFRIRDILKDNKLNFTSKYSLYRDWKAKIGNLLLGPGYVIFAYFVASIFLDLPVMFPKFTLSWYLMLFLTVMMIERQLLRFLAVKNVYGYKSAFISSALPPLLPFRMLLGTIINFHSTVNALSINMKKSKKAKANKKPKWSKTEHEFLEESILKRYRRNLGDTLLYKGLISPEELNKALSLSRQNNEKLGFTINRLNLVSESQIVKAVCEVNQDIYVEINPGSFSNKYKSQYGEKKLKQLKAIPIFNTAKGMVVLTTLDSSKEDIRDTFMADKISFVYTTKSIICDILKYSINDTSIEKKFVDIERYIELDLITAEQGLFSIIHSKDDLSIDQTLNSMGLLIEDKKKKLLAI